MMIETGGVQEAKHVTIAELSYKVLEFSRQLQDGMYSAVYTKERKEDERKPMLPSVLDEIIEVLIETLEVIKDSHNFFVREIRLKIN